MNLVAWFRGAWPNRSARDQAIAEYARLGQSRHLLADVAKRGLVFGVPAPPRDLYQAGLIEGRRQFALEFIRMAQVDPAALQQLCLEPPRKDDK